MRAYLSLAGLAAAAVGWLVSTAERDVGHATPESVMRVAEASASIAPELRREEVSPAAEARRTVRIVYPAPYEAR